MLPFGGIQDLENGEFLNEDNMAWKEWMKGEEKGESLKGKWTCSVDISLISRDLEFPCPRDNERHFVDDAFRSCRAPIRSGLRRDGLVNRLCVPAMLPRRNVNVFVCLFVYLFPSLFCFFFFYFLFLCVFILVYFSPFLVILFIYLFIFS